MARGLTKKQRGFVNDYAETGNGTQAALKNYNIGTKHGTISPLNVADSIASENLQKPAIIAELKILGFDTNNAKKVVGQILDNNKAENKDRLKAAELVFKANKVFDDSTEPKFSNPTYNIFINNSKDISELEAKIKEKLSHES